MAWMCKKLRQRIKKREKGIKKRVSIMSYRIGCVKWN